MLADLPCSHAVPVGVVKEQVKIARYVPEHSQQQRYLSTVMHTVIGRVLQ
jgi:hypothetical protein